MAGNPSDLYAVDLGMLILIAVIWPIYNYLNLLKHPIEEMRNDPNIRLSSYNETLLHLWGICILIGLTWVWKERPLSDLGFQHQLNWMTGVVWAFALTIVLFSSRQLCKAIHNPAESSKMREQLQKVGERTRLLMPITKQEHRRCLAVGISAGFTEEVIFRGYLIWLFSHYFTEWISGIISIGIFVLLHLYQEKAGLIQVCIFALIATSLYIVSGSLWPVIFLHIGVDVFNITLAYKVWNSQAQV